MLQISREQLKMFEQVQRDAFLDGCLRVLQVDDPNLATSRPALPDEVRRLIAQLTGIGFTHSGDCEYALRLLFKYQQVAQSEPMPEAIVDKLRSVFVTTEKKIEALEQLFIFGRNPGRAHAELPFRDD